MTFTTATLAARLTELETASAKPKRFVVALSGGLDSVVLTHCIAKLATNNQSQYPQAVAAVHVDHGLHEESRSWASHCENFAQDLGIEFECLQVSVANIGKGLEAAARESRYTALALRLRPGDWLLSAHHQDDQAETLLLNLMRGSGPAGLAGIGPMRRLGDAHLVRPLLGIDRAALKRYAEQEALQWLDDPSNNDQRFDRNYLRHEALPVLKARWPSVVQKLQRSATLAGESADLLSDLAVIDLQDLGGDAARLPVDGLRALSKPRQRNLLRHAARQLDLPSPPAQQLEQIVEEVLPARVDSQPRVDWPGASVRRYRNTLFCLTADMPTVLMRRQFDGAECLLGPGLGRLQLAKTTGLGLSDDIVGAGLEVRPRYGGEEIKLLGQSHTKKLKKLLQAQGVLPWMRDRLPLVYSGEKLVAVGDLFLAADAVTEAGSELRWIDGPALH